MENNISAEYVKIYDMAGHMKGSQKRSKTHKMIPPRCDIPFKDGYTRKSTVCVPPLQKVVNTIQSRYTIRTVEKLNL